MTDIEPDDPKMLAMLHALAARNRAEDDALALAINRATGCLVTVERTVVPMLAGGGSREMVSVTFHAQGVRPLTAALSRRPA